ncbi:hypothetical protein D5R81_01925 [Parashewanella spongiae]|uniref:Uncharacterized protein n=1 Tax=Parashewanella spongiae TaxID=342950 RepID=A0A3A6UBZ3_9GAMM|nr:hypothetical protein [Parashewanella spongiae]MCL1076884.1 hypothetical protein [Parashewanella spongiae]RJY19134.1 hypothetical protein D5R81_01925 [Parashewanella spongiae]
MSTPIGGVESSKNFVIDNNSEHRKSCELKSPNPKVQSKPLQEGDVPTPHETVLQMQLNSTPSTTHLTVENMTGHAEQAGEMVFIPDDIGALSNVAREVKAVQATDSSSGILDAASKKRMQLGSSHLAPASCSSDNASSSQKCFHVIKKSDKDVKQKTNTSAFSGAGNQLLSKDGKRLTEKHQLIEKQQNDDIRQARIKYFTQS